MKKPLHGFLASLILMISVAYGGLFPVFPGEQLFPFFGESSITPNYPPFEPAGIVNVLDYSGNGLGGAFILTERVVQGFFHAWLYYEDLLSRSKHPEIRWVLYRLTLVLLEPGLEPAQIIFPFHEFW